MPLAYLFTYRVVPVIDGKLVSADRLRTVKVSDNQGEEHTAFVFALTARQLADDDYRLWVDGAGNKPLVDVPFSEGTTTEISTGGCRGQATRRSTDAGGCSDYGLWQDHVSSCR